MNNCKGGGNTKSEQPFRSMSLPRWSSQSIKLKAKGMSDS
jgi:hypothetical protein